MLIYCSISDSLKNELKLILELRLLYIGLCSLHTECPEKKRPTCFL